MSRIKKREIDLLVLSDIHLGTIGCNAKYLLQYLLTIKPKKVILNGDIIDIWQFKKKYFPKSHMKIIKHILGWESNDVEVPVLGKIAAGTPLEAIQNEVSRIPLPSNLEKNGDYFGLKVQGDSMIEAGINEGDTVIIKRTDTADNGKIVVALIDEHEAMLKRIRKKGKVVALESANKNYETKIFGPDRVKVQGVLVSLYRNF